MYILHVRYSNSIIIIVIHIIIFCIISMKRDA